jgi:hypothetical protein
MSVCKIFNLSFRLSRDDVFFYFLRLPFLEPLIFNYNFRMSQTTIKKELSDTHLKIGSETDENWQD